MKTSIDIAYSSDEPSTTNNLGVVLGSPVNTVRDIRTSQRELSLKWPLQKQPLDSKSLTNQGSLTGQL
ncbi:hypothetical protein GCM10028816_12070 [Spirosoma lituiforme]